MMTRTIVLAPDSFKESLTAKEVCEALEAGLRQSLPDATFVHVPMADGGEGTVQSLVDATGGELRTHDGGWPVGGPGAGHLGSAGRWFDRGDRDGGGQRHRASAPRSP